MTYNLTEFQSLCMYFSIVAGATVFAFLSNFFKRNKKINLFFLTISFFILLIPLIIRVCGPDYNEYVQMYKNISNPGYFRTYALQPEPLYVLLNYLVFIIFDHVQFVFIISGVLSLGLFYLFFLRVSERVSITILVFLFSTTVYILMFGLVRIFIAVSIITFGFKYLEFNKNYKYTICVIIASLFHYSAFFSLIFLLLKNKESIKIGIKTTNISRLKRIIYISISFFSACYLFPLIFGDFAWFGRYSGYFKFYGNLNIIKNIYVFFPLIIALFLMKKGISKRINYGALYINLFDTMIIVILLSMIFPLMRLSYYSYPCGLYLYAGMPMLFKDSLIKKIYYVGLFIIGFISICFALFISELWYPYLIPYYYRIL